MANISVGWDLAGWTAIVIGLTLLAATVTWASWQWVDRTVLNRRWGRRDDRELEVLLANALDLETDPIWDDE